MRDGNFTETTAARQRSLLFVILGLACFWQTFRYSNYFSLFSFSRQVHNAEAWFSLFMILAFAVALLLLFANSRLKSPGFWEPFVVPLSCLPALLTLAHGVLPMLWEGPLSVAVFSAELVAQACALSLLLLEWTRCLAARFDLISKECILCVTASFALEFFLATFCALFAESAVALAVVTMPASGACLALVWRQGGGARSGLSEGAGSEDGRASRKASRSLVVLMAAVAVFFFLTLSISGAINSSELNPLSKASDASKHVATIAAMIAFAVLVLFCDSWQKRYYLGWLLFSVVFLTGLFLIGFFPPGTAAALAGNVLATASRGCFELLLFLLVLANAQTRSIGLFATMFFLAPESVASVVSRSVLPGFFSWMSWTFVDYAALLSVVCSVVFVVLMLALLVVELFKRIESEEKGLDAGGHGGEDRSHRGSFEEALSFLDLTAREKVVAEALLRGYSAERIADDESLSVNTVRTHTKNIYRKLDVHSRQELIDLVEGFADGAQR